MRRLFAVALALASASCVAGPGPSLELRPSTAYVAPGGAGPKTMLVVLAVSGGFRDDEARKAFKALLNERLAACGVAIGFMSPSTGGSRVFSKEVLEDGRDPAALGHDHALLVREVSYQVSGGLTTSYLDAVLKRSGDGKEVWRMSATVRRTMIMRDGMNEFAAALVDRLSSDRILPSCRKAAGGEK